MNRQEIRKIAIYLILILAIIRFLIVPQASALKEKQELFQEIKETYEAKLILLQRNQGQEIPEKTSFDEDSIYDKGVSYTDIQTELLQNVLSIVEREGLSLVNYEMPEATPSKILTDVPVIIRLKGKPQAFNNFLFELLRYDKKIKFRQFETIKQEPDNTFNFTLITFRAEK
ncbi:MAG TPA: hypothetical protein HPP56_02640 [Nitrospirae bacterium]|nr:hypothetical protein [Nitrospirota bacterium]